MGKKQASRGSDFWAGIYILKPHWGFTYSCKHSKHVTETVPNNFYFSSWKMQSCVNSNFIHKKSEKNVLGRNVLQVFIHSNLPFLWHLLQEHHARYWILPLLPIIQYRIQSACIWAQDTPQVCAMHHPSRPINQTEGTQERHSKGLEHLHIYGTID